MKEFLKLVHFWRSYRQKGLIASHSPFLNMQPHDLYTCFRLSLFSDINVSQGSVGTLVRCGGIFNANFIANFVTSQPVKEL